MFFPSRRGKSRFPQIYTNAKRAALGLPHRGAKEQQRLYREVTGRNGHTTIRRVA